MRYNFCNFYLILGVVFISGWISSGCKTEAGQEPSRPNIVLVMADDMGFSDVGAFGGEIETPNLDQLAEGGLRFTQFYNAGRCVPTRGSLLTGLYPHQAGVGWMVAPSDRPGYLGRLNERSVTFAEVLKEAGYQTFMSGKWHVTHYEYTNPEPTLHRESWPLQRGFDRFFGTLSGAGSYYSPVSLMQDNEFIEPEEDFYYTDAITEHAIRFIEESNSERPFLLYVSNVAPHWPLHALLEHVRKFENEYNEGWDTMRADRRRRMAEEGIISDDWPLTPRDERVPSWDEASDKSWENYRMAVYAAQVYSMDLGVGRLIETLKANGRFENTLILFLSDNGASSEIIQGTDTRHGYFERGGTTPEVFPGEPDTYASYGIGWANASNTPFRLYKSWMHEGGIATPLIAHWPEVIAENDITHQTGHIMDLMATFIDISGAEYPETKDGQQITPIEGRSLLPIFQGETREGHEAIYWEHEGNRAVRQENWKLVSVDNGEWELYDMEGDRTEMNNVVEEYPEKASRMAEMWEEWAVRSNVK